ncbi:unnamed protein product [Litomosoides sigmodontis]|uniref:Uncharacterized protein n=1 Tax=Litomosoides sigmodontis TaxID=42156 RepID=A0A3P6SV15_LITSI|nr:unnamed protein product [Litomosoides sigmodontis]
MTSTVTMNDDLLDNYNPLYDVHLRQYFAMPHMQRHLRNIGLLDDAKRSDDITDKESTKQHHAIIDKILRNREAELQKYADLQRKLHAAEKIEICRRIRSGATSPSDYHRAKPSRSLSRGRYIKRLRRRRSSTSIDDKDLVQRIEAENEEPVYENPSLLDDETLALYMEQLRRQLSRLERFRQVSFGPFSVARHQNDPQVSWFFRRRSLPSLTDTTTTITTTTTTITSTTQSNIHEQPTLRSIQQLNQHRSRSNKPKSQGNGMSDNSLDNRSQSKRQRSTENSARLPPVSRNVKSGSGQAAMKQTRTIKSIAAEAKKTAEKTTTTPTGRKPSGVAQKIRPKIDSELSHFQMTISCAPKLIDKSKMELDDRGSERSALNLDDEQEAYSSFASPESTDLKSGGQTEPEKSVLPLSHTEMPLNDEKALSQSKIQQLKVEENSNMPSNLSPEILEKTELELRNAEMPINENQKLAENEIETEKKPKRLPTFEHSIAGSGTLEIDKLQVEEMFTKLASEGLTLEEDKITVGATEKSDEIISSPAAITLETETPENKLAERSDVEMCINSSEMLSSTDNGTPSHTEMVNRKVTSNETDVNAEEILAAREGLEETVENRNAIDEGPVSSAASLRRFSDVVEMENALCRTESDGEQEIPVHLEQVAEVELATDQGVVGGEHAVERLPKFPVPAISVTDDESSELARSQDSIGSAQELSNANDLGEKSEIANGVVRREEELECAEDMLFQMEKLQKLEYEGRSIAAEGSAVDGSEEGKIQQPVVNMDDHLECAFKLETDEQSKSFFTGNISLIENHYSKIKEELQQEKEEEPEECLRVEISPAESETEAATTDNEVQKVNDVLEMKSEPAGNESVTQQLLQYMRSVPDNEERKAVVHEIALEADEAVEVQKEKLPEVILLNPEKLIVDGLTNHSEPVIVGMQESQPRILAPLEKQKSDGQGNASTYNTLDAMSSSANGISEKECGTDEILKECVHELNSTVMELNLFEPAVGSLVSDILRSGVTSLESNSEITFEEKSEKTARSVPPDNAEVEGRNGVVEEDEALSEVHCASSEVLPAEVILCEDLKKISDTENFKYGEEIPKIVVCSDETTTSHAINMENLVVKLDSERVEQFQVDPTETLREEKRLQEESGNEEVMASVKKHFSEELDDGKQLIGEHLNEHSQQFMHGTVQDVTELVRERAKGTGKDLEEAIEQVEMEEISESQRNDEFLAQISANGFSKSDFEEVLRKDVESVDSNSNILTTMTKSIHPDGSTTASESCNTTGEPIPIAVSHLYQTSIKRESQNGDGYESNFEYDVSSGRLESGELKLKEGKSELEIPQTTCGKSFTNNVFPECLIISGLTADGQLILSSVSDPMQSSEHKFSDYFPLNDGAYETVSDKVPLISDRNGNPEWKVSDVQHCPSDVMNESNACAADVNANISPSQQSINHKEEMEEHDMVTDEDVFLEQSYAGADECEVENVKIMFQNFFAFHFRFFSRILDELADRAMPGKDEWTERAITQVT